jgi:L-ribulose-5-phosphate 3-epimerase
MNTISFMTANYVARQMNYDLGDGDWGHGDRSTQQHFRPVETFGERFEVYLKDIKELGFEALDLWTGILHPTWATDEHIATARDLLKQYGLQVVSLAGYFGRNAEEFEMCCKMASELGAPVLGGGTGLLANRDDRALMITTLRRYGVRFGYENHPEKTPEEALNQLLIGGEGRRHVDNSEGELGITVDTGWWGTYSYDAPTAMRELAPYLVHVHLKDVLAAGGHETCRYGEGIVDIRGCVQALKEIGYEGAISVEHEPHHFDPTDDIIASTALLRQWLAE